MQIFKLGIKLGCFGSVLKSVKAQETPQAFSFYMVTIKGALDPTVILRGSVPVNPLFAHKFLLVCSFLNISPIIFHQSWISWSFFNTEFPEEFKTGITFKI